MSRRFRGDHDVQEESKTRPRSRDRHTPSREEMENYQRMKEEEERARKAEASAEKTLRDIQRRVEARKKGKKGITRVFKREDGTIDYGKWVVIFVVAVIILLIILLGPLLGEDEFCSCRF